MREPRLQDAWFLMGRSYLAFHAGTDAQLHHVIPATFCHLRDCIPIPCIFSPWSDWQEATCEGLCTRSRIVQDCSAMHLCVANLWKDTRLEVHSKLCAGCQQRVRAAMQWTARNYETLRCRLPKSKRLPGGVEKRTNAEPESSCIMHHVFQVTQWSEWSGCSDPGQVRVLRCGVCSRHPF